MSLWTWAWIGWALIFGLIEGLALANSRSGDTLSEHAWSWLGVRLRRDPKGFQKMPSGWVRIRRIILVSFLVWLVLHFATGGWV